jgi:hypothetical protein
MIDPSNPVEQPSQETDPENDFVESETEEIFEPEETIGDPI